MIRPGDKVAIAADWHPRRELVVEVRSVDAEAGELRLVTGLVVRCDEVRKVEP